MTFKPIALFVVAALTSFGAHGAVASSTTPPSTHGTRYTQSDLAFRGYDKIVVEPLEVQYDEASPDRDAYTRHVERVCDASVTALKEAVGARFAIVTDPGPGTIRLRASVTGVRVEEKRRRFWQYTPVGLVKRSIDVARGADVALQTATIEIALVDAMTGETLATVADTDDYASWRAVVARLDGWIRHIIDDPRRTVGAS
jgi:hypothetical protein